MDDKILRGLEVDKKRPFLTLIDMDSRKPEWYYFDLSNGQKWIEEYSFSLEMFKGEFQLRLVDKFPFE